jgi:transcriptional regulator with XRE-family HTH domain
MRSVAMNALIRRAFERSGKTRAQVATECGVSTVSVTCWLNGTRNPSTKSLTRFVEVCGMAMAEFYGADEPAPALDARDPEAA